MDKKNTSARTSRNKTSPSKSRITSANNMSAGISIPDEMVPKELRDRIANSQKKEIISYTEQSKWKSSILGIHPLVVSLNL